MKNFTRKKITRFRKISCCLAFALIISLPAFSQNAGISPTGAALPNAASGLDINFTTKGLLIPRVALTGTGNASPLPSHVNGMVVYNTATVTDVIPGIYIDNGTRWTAFLPPDGTAVGDMQYWDGTVWKRIPAGLPNQKLQLNLSGVPTWVP